MAGRTHIHTKRAYEEATAGDGVRYLVDRLWPVSDDKIGFDYKLKRLLEGSGLPADDAHFFWNGACTPAERRALVPALFQQPASCSFCRSLVLVRGEV